jgi:hypothetical protein
VNGLYLRNGIVYGEVSLAGQSLNEHMLRMGYGWLSISKVFPVPESLSQLVEAYESAKKSHLGIFGPDGDQPADSICIEVISPLEIRIFNIEGVSIWRLSGVKTIGYSYVVWREAVSLLEEKLLWHDIEIVGSRLLEKGTREDVRISLVESGMLGAVDPWLMNVKTGAKQVKKGVWKNDIEPPNFVFPCLVTYVVSPATIMVQSQSPALAMINRDNSTCERVSSVIPGVIYLMVVNYRKFRMVLLDGEYYAIDYGFSVHCEVAEVFECPRHIQNLGLQCWCVKLADVCPFDRPEYDEIAMKYIWNIFDRRGLYHVVMVKDEMIPSVVLRDSEGALVQSVLLRDGAVRIDNQTIGESAFSAELINMEKSAKQRGAGGWNSKWS